MGVDGFFTDFAGTGKAAKDFETQPYVQSPDNPALANLSEAEKVKAANLPRSKGFEGTALSADGTKLYSLLEGPLTTDLDQRRLLIYEFDLKTEKYTGKVYSYQLDGAFPNRAIGDMTAINDHEFLVLERDNGQGNANNPAFTNPARSKKVYKIDINKIDSAGYVDKELLADELNISDPNGLGGNGTQNGVFTFPFNTIEDVLPIDPQTLLIVDDNNYPFSSARTPGQADNNEFIKIKLNKPLDLHTTGTFTLPNGLAAGDTTQTSSVLWTHSTIPGQVTFEYSTDPTFSNAQTVTTTATNISQPVKVQIDGLQSGTDYYYRAINAVGESATGKLHTSAPLGTHSGLTFGISGDWRGELSPYPSISNAANSNLEFFLEFGDTIYADYPSPAVSAEQATTLQQYRDKHNEVYSGRAGLNAFGNLRASTSILATIDDHEVANDFAGGAPISSDRGGPNGTNRFLAAFPDDNANSLLNDSTLFENGLQAFQEYNPIRDEFYGETGDSRTAGERKLYRYNTYGSDAAVFTLDQRSFRDQELPG